MKELLDRISIEMLRVNPQGLQRFNRGITQKEIDVKLTGFPVLGSAFSEVLELLKWRNGGLSCAEQQAVSFIPGYMLLSLDEIIIHYDMTKSFPENFGKYWIPFLNDFSNGYYFYDVRDCSVIDFMPEEVEVRRYSSMSRFLNAVYECYKQNVFFLDEQENLNSNIQEEQRIFLSYGEVLELDGF